MKKFLVLAALLSSTSVMASDNSLPDLEEVKKGFTASNLTVDVDSEAGKLYQQAVRKEEQKDDEAKLLEAVQFGHASASYILFQQYGNENPAYRKLLVMSVLKKLETGFTRNLEEEMTILGHNYLKECNYSLVTLWRLADHIGRKKVSSYIVGSTWKELGAHIEDLDQAENVVFNARQFLDAPYNKYPQAIPSAFHDLSSDSEDSSSDSDDED